MSETALEVAEVSRRFGGLTAVDAVSLKVPSGERLAVLGPNGAGKTTLFNCIAGALPVSAGAIHLFGRRVTGLDPAARAHLGLARTFQISDVFTELTARENVLLALFGCRPTKWRLFSRWAAMTAEIERADSLLADVGLETRSQDAVEALSYGERRQLELALALGTNPKLLLLDEPCAGLAQAERERFVALVKGLPRAITLLLIEHDMDVAFSLAERVVVMERGRKVMAGTPEEVRNSPEVREIYLGDL